ncbi:hypothetical protein [Chondrinema litorale]|uniref:hypothetical protein n=1 Tax=Chondrinema litorale TaxID=2994555 RepID=UPI00254308EA|nr:hypothetical protein [Chondrinema litorale]UZR99972.1 hypothetical protein OQ292_39475 [Chondrinema litorale]
MKNRQQYKQLVFLGFFLLSFLSLDIAAQSIVENGIFQKYYFMNTKSLEQLDELKRLAWSANSKFVDVSQVKADGKYLAAQKSKKKYDELTFTLDGRRLVTSGKVYFTKVTIYSQGAYRPKIEGVSIVPSSDVLYQGSGKLFASINDIEGNTIKPSGNMYNEDGSILYSEELDETGQYIFRTARKPNGEYDFMLYSNIGGMPYVHSKIGAYTENMVYPFNPLGTYNKFIAPRAKETSLINFENGDRYIGFSTAGSYDSRRYGTFTGYMVPLFMEYGNGGVFFLEQPWSDVPYKWALVVDGEIEMTIPAMEQEKPQVDSLLNNLVVDMDYYGSSYLNKGTDDEKSIVFGTMSGHVLSKDTANLTGYGIKFHTSDSIFKGDHSYLEVGNFQNGKLHGMGYRVNMTRLYNDKYSGNPKNEDEDYLAFATRVKGAAGVFNNGVLVDGRKLEIDNGRKTYKNGNRWKYISVKGFAFIGRVPLSFKGSVYYGEMPYTGMTTDNPYVYISEIQRLIKVLEVDTKNKAIKVMGDYGEPVWLDENSGPIYWLYSAKTVTQTFCPKTITSKKYKEINVQKSIPRNTTTVRKVNGAIVDYYYTTHKSDPIEYTVKQTVLDGYETVTCPVCHGEGIVSVQANNSQYKQLVFK